MVAFRRMSPRQLMSNDANQEICGNYCAERTLLRWFERKVKEGCLIIRISTTPAQRLGTFQHFSAPAVAGVNYINSLVSLTLTRYVIVIAQ